MVVRVVLLVLLVATGTWLVGWWAVPLLAALYAAVRRQSAAPAEVAAGTMLSWALLMLTNAGAPAFGVLVARLGGIFPVPGLVVLLVAILFAGLLAWSSARVTLGITGVRVGRVPAV